VDFSRIGRVFPDFAAQWRVADGAAQLHRVFDAISLTAETFYGRGHTRLRQIEYLLHTGQLDSRLFWTDTAVVSTAV
jgi:hypothetical protein